MSDRPSDDLSGSVQQYDASLDRWAFRAVWHICPALVAQEPDPRAARSVRGADGRPSTELGQRDQIWLSYAKLAWSRLIDFVDTSANTISAPRLTSSDFTWDCARRNSPSRICAHVSIASLCFSKNCQGAKRTITKTLLLVSEITAYRLLHERHSYLG